MIEAVRSSAPLNSRTDSPDVGRALVIGHQGMNTNAPGNTMSAFRAAEPYVDLVECDIQFTRDRVMVVFHDRTLDDSTTGTGPVAALSHRQLRRCRLRDGSRIPTFRELLRWARRTRILLIAELKLDGWTREQAQAYSRVIRTSGMRHRVIASSFDPANLAHLKAVDPGITRAYVYSRSVPSIDALRTAGSISMPWMKNITADDVAAQQAAGLQVWCWTARSDAQYRAAVDLGVDAVVADDPAALRGWLETAGARGPSLAARAR